MSYYKYYENKYSKYILIYFSHVFYILKY